MNGQQLVATIRSRGGRVALGPGGTLEVDTTPALARLVNQHADDVRAVLRAPRRPADQWYAETDGPAEVWGIFAEICGAPNEPMPVGFSEHLAVQADAGFNYTDISAGMGRYMRGTPAQPPVAGWRLAFDLTGAAAIALREERYPAMTDADLREEEKRWVAEQARIAAEERPFQEIVAELDAAERRAERGGRR